MDPDGLAVKDVDWSVGEALVVGCCFTFGECELEGTSGGFTGPGLSSTLGLEGVGSIVWEVEASLEFVVVEGGIVKEREGGKKDCGYVDFGDQRRMGMLEDVDFRAKETERM
jgi:hypothetical protein